MEEQFKPATIEKTREIELLEELVNETKANSEFTKRFSYVMFCLSVIALVVALSALFFSIKTSEITEGEKWVLIFFGGLGLIALFIAMLREARWDN